VQRIALCHVLIEHVFTHFVWCNCAKKSSMSNISAQVCSHFHLPVSEKKKNIKITTSIGAVVTKGKGLPCNVAILGAKLDRILHDVSARKEYTEGVVVRTQLHSIYSQRIQFAMSSPVTVVSAICNRKANRRSF